MDQFEKEEMKKKKPIKVNWFDWLIKESDGKEIKNN